MATQSSILAWKIPWMEEPGQLRGGEWFRCLILCKSMDCSPSGSSVHGILQARILEWVVISYSR